MWIRTAAKGPLVRDSGAQYQPGQMPGRQPSEQGIRASTRTRRRLRGAARQALGAGPTCGHPWARARAGPVTGPLATSSREPASSGAGSRALWGGGRRALSAERHGVDDGALGSSGVVIAAVLRLTRFGPDGLGQKVVASCLTGLVLAVPPPRVSPLVWAREAAASAERHPVRAGLPLTCLRGRGTGSQTDPSLQAQRPSGPGDGSGVRSPVAPASHLKRLAGLVYCERLAVGGTSAFSFRHRHRQASRE